MNFTGQSSIWNNNNEWYQCRITIFSPVNVNVYVNDKKHFLMYVDNNSGFDYKAATATVGQTFTLIFVSKGFELNIEFKLTYNHRIEYHLEEVLSKQDIEQSFDRDEALEQLNDTPTGYAFKQLAYKGTERDIDVIVNVLQDMVNNSADSDQDMQYLIAKAVYTIAILERKYGTNKCHKMISDIYQKYPAKNSYGYIIKTALEKYSS